MFGDKESIAGLSIDRRKAFWTLNKLFAGMHVELRAVPAVPRYVCHVDIYADFGVAIGFSLHLSSKITCPFVLLDNIALPKQRIENFLVCRSRQTGVTIFPTFLFEAICRMDNISCRSWLFGVVIFASAILRESEDFEVMFFVERTIVTDLDAATINTGNFFRLSLFQFIECDGDVDRLASKVFQNSFIPIEVS